METAQQQHDDVPNLRDTRFVATLVRNVRGYLRAPSAEDRAFMDHKFCEYWDIVDAHGAASPQAREFRTQLRDLPWGIRTEIVRLCDSLDKRNSERPSAGES